MSLSPFDHARDRELGNALRDALTAKDDDAFAAQVIARLTDVEGLRPASSNWWEVLNALARPGLAAAILGLVTALSVWMAWGPVAPQVDLVLDNPLQPANEAFVTTAFLTTTEPPAVDLVLGMALEDVPSR